MDERRRVRHRPHDRDTGRQACLDLRGRDGGGDGQDRLLRCDQPSDLPEQDVKVLRLHRDNDQSGFADGLSVGKDRFDAVPLRDLIQVLLAAARDDDVTGLPPAGAEQPGEQRLADLAGSQNRDASIRGHIASLGPSNSVLLRQGCAVRSEDLLVAEDEPRQHDRTMRFER